MTRWVRLQRVDEEEGVDEAHGRILGCGSGSGTCRRAAHDAQEDDAVQTFRQQGTPDPTGKQETGQCGPACAGQCGPACLFGQSKL